MRVSHTRKLPRDGNFHVVVSTIGSLRVMSALEFPLVGLSACIADSKKFQAICLRDDDNKMLCLKSYVPIPNERLSKLEVTRKYIDYLEMVSGWLAD